MQVLMEPSSLGDTAQDGFKCPLAVPRVSLCVCVSWVTCRSGVDKDAVTARKANDDLHFFAFDAAFTVLSQSRTFVINPHVMITCMRRTVLFRKQQHRMEVHNIWISNIGHCDSGAFWLHLASIEPAEKFCPSSLVTLCIMSATTNLRFASKCILRHVGRRPSRDWIRTFHG